MFSAKPFTAESVDLNADVGEHDSRADQCPDLALIRVVTSVSVACGMHAGTASTMRDTVRMARQHGVSVGAHPSFADREGFGRREMHLTVNEVEDLVVHQIGALQAIAADEGVTLRHVKPHGALYNMAARESRLAEAIARAVREVDRRLILYGLAGSALIHAGRAAGLRTASEVFADRAYRPDGSLVPRGEPGAVLEDPDVVAGHAVALVTDATGVGRRADTICVHGDTPNAIVLAQRIRAAIEAAGLQVRPLPEH